MGVDMNRKITVINSTSHAIEIQSVPAVVLELGAKDYTLKQSVVDQIVRETSNMPAVTVQLEKGAKPSTVDGKQNAKQLQGVIDELTKDLGVAQDELLSSKAALELAQADNATLTEKVAELEKQLKESSKPELVSTEEADKEATTEEAPPASEDSADKKPAKTRKQATSKSKE